MTEERISIEIFTGGESLNVTDAFVCPPGLVVSFSSALSSQSPTPQRRAQQTPTGNTRSERRGGPSRLSRSTPDRTACILWVGTTASRVGE